MDPLAALDRDLVGFCGVLLVTRPGAGGIHLGGGLSAMGAVCYAIYFDFDAHPRAPRQHRHDQLLFQSGGRDPRDNDRTVLCGRRRPNWRVILLMCSMGLFSGMGHYLLIIGHRLAPASVLAPFIYTEII